MRAVLTLLLAAIVCVAAAWFVSGLPGMVSATIAGTTLEASTPVALTLAAVLFLILYVIVRLLAGLVRLPRHSRRWRQHRNRVRGDVAVTRALTALAANDPGAARREAARSRRLLGDTPLTLLLTAQAGRQAGREAEAEAAFRQLADNKEGRLLGLRGLLRQAMLKQDWPAASSLAAQAEAVHPGAAWLRDERRQVAVRTGQWEEAMRLSGDLPRASFALAAAAAATEPGTATRLAKQAFELDPALAPAAVLYATRLRSAGRDRAAYEVLRRAWAAAPQPEIGAAFLSPAPDALSRAREATSLANANPTSPESFILTGRAALEAGLTAEARRQVEAARAQGMDQQRLWVLLADIEMMDGNPEAAKDAAAHLSTAAPDPAWRCSNCGTVHAAWHPVCDACEATSSITWTQHAAPAITRHAQLAAPQEAEGLAS